MPAAAATGCRKGRRQSCFPSCFSSSAVFDSNDSPALRSDKAPGHSPEALSWGVRRQNKTVPLLEEITADGDRHVAEYGEIKREVPPSVSSPAAANRHKELPEKHRKEEKRCKFTGAKPLTYKTISTCSNKRSSNQHSSINHQPTTTLHKVNRRGPVQSRARTKTNHSGLTDPTRLVRSTQASPSLDLLTGLKMVAMMLVTILIGGKIFAIFITTLWFYLLSCVGRSGSQIVLVSAQKILRR